MKNLENIPEVQLVKRGDSGIEKYEIGKDAFPFNGYFIAVIKTDGPLSRDSPKEQLEKLNNPEYIFSGNKIKSHPILTRIFKKRYGDYLEGNEQFRTINGGELEITDNKIRFYGKSGTFGEYRSRDISPLVERFAKENLPNHEIVYE